MDPIKVIDKIIVSKVRIKVIHHFLTGGENPIHLRGLVRALDEEINSVRREVNRLEKLGFLSSEVKGNRKNFTVNEDFVFYDELLALTYKTHGLGAAIISNQPKIGDIKFAVITSGLMREESLGKHKMDLVIVGDGLNMQRITKIVEEEEQRIGRDIYYAVLDEKDFDMRKSRRDLFMQELLMQELVVLIGHKTDLYKGIH